MTVIGRHTGFVPQGTTCVASTICCTQSAAIAAWEGQTWDQISRDLYQAHGKMPILDKEHEQLVRKMIRLVAPLLMELANSPLRGTQFDQAFIGKIFQDPTTFATLRISRYGTTGYSLYFEPPYQDGMSAPECEIVDLKTAQEVVNIAKALLLELGNV